MTIGQTVILIIAATLLILWVAWRFYRHATRVERRLGLLLDALDSGDTSLRFPHSSDREVNAKLNRISARLASLKRIAVETDRYYESIISQTSTGVLVTDLSHHVVMANPAALRLLNRVALTHISALKDEFPQLTAFLESATSGSKATIGKFAVTVSDFTRPDNGKHIIITLDDISAQIEAASVDSWIEMSRVLTHEIMNGIAPVVSIADTLKLRYRGSDESFSDGLDAISESSTALKNFVARYNRLTRLPRPEATIFALQPFLSQCVELSSGKSSSNCAGSHVKYLLNLPTETVTAYADRGQLQQVILNLLKNAVEAEATTVKITLTEEIDTVISIENNGRPIPESDAEKIFTPFFTTKPTGSGIGLSLSRRIIKENGGTLSYVPKRQTTRFTITLPKKTFIEENPLETV